MSKTAQLQPQTFAHAPRTAWRKVADEAVILDVETAAYYSLDGSGLRIWELLGQGLDLSAIAGVLAEEYDAPVETIRKDLDELVLRLRREKILEPR